MAKMRAPIFLCFMTPKTYVTKSINFNIAQIIIC